MLALRWTLNPRPRGQPNELPVARLHRMSDVPSKGAKFKFMQLCQWHSCPMPPLTGRLRIQI